MLGMLFDNRGSGRTRDATQSEGIMAVKHAFSVRASEGATQHNVEVTIPSFEEATDQQRRTAWAKSIRTITIDVQGSLRSTLKKQPATKPATLNAEATRLFMGHLNQTTGRPVFTLDLNVEPYASMDDEQVAALVATFEAQGFEVVKVDRKA
jgi:hypothetical protein